MKKKILKLIVSALFTVITLASCVTINSGAALASSAPIGSKVGETNSAIICGIISLNGAGNNIKKAAEKAAIKNVTQVEYVDKLVFGGFLINHKTRVYGE